MLQNHPDSALKYADSVLRIISKLQVEDSVKTMWIQLKTDAFIALGINDSASNIQLKLREQALKDGNFQLQANADLWLGQQFTDEGKYFMAGKFLKEGLSLYEKSGNEYQVARAHNLTGSLLSINGNYEEALEHLIEASGIFEKLGKPLPMAAVYNNIATNYQATNDMRKALFYFKRSMAISLQNHDTINLVSTLNNLGIHYQIDKPDSAEYYFTEALKYQMSPRVAYEIISVKFNLANLYFNRKEYGRAMPVYLQVTEICRSKNILGGLAKSYNGIANIYEASNDNSRAMDFYQKAYQLADSIGEKPAAMLFLDNIRYMFEKTGNFKQALSSFKKIKTTNDSLLSLEKQIAVHDLEMLYNNEKHARENEELNTRILFQKSRIRTNNIILIIVLVFLTGLSFLLWNIYKLYKQRDEAYNSLIIKYREDLLQQAHGKLTKTSVLIGKQKDPGKEDDLFAAIVNYFETEKPYLNAKLKIEDVATSLNLSQKTIVSALQRNLEIHFKTFVNSYRINEAKRMLADPKSRNFKIETISKESGFGSKVNFYSAFSQFTGSKPTIFRDSGLA